MVEKFTKESYMKAEREWFKSPHGYLRFGQALCNHFDLPKEIEAKIYYESDTKKVQVIIWSSFNDTVSDKELTPEQIARQDFVDNEIRELLFRLLNGVVAKNIPEWKLSETVTEIRQLILHEYIDTKNEMDFYPYLEE